jgi:biopolymer transport protein ExbD
MTTIQNEAGINLVPPRKRIQEDTELDITPMIDIVFLLLSFFVVASKMDPQFALELPKAVYGDAISDKLCVVIVVKQSETPGKFDIFKGRGTEPERLVMASDTLGQEQEIAEFVEKELSSRPDVQVIMIKGEALVTTGTIETVKRGISQSEMAQSRKIFLGTDEGASY